MNWGELITLEYGKPVKDKESTDGEVPVYGTNGQIGTSHLPAQCKHPSFILGRKGAYRGVHYSDCPFSVIDTAFFAEPLTDKIDLKWAYYKFLTYDINRMDSGSAIPSTDRYQIYSIEVEVPPMEEQKKVVAILDCIDKKIKANWKINDNLRLQIKEICTAWLTNFQPFGGQMPSDWIETPLSEIAEFISGYSYKGNELATSTVAMATIKNFDRNGGFKVEGYKEIIPSAKLKGSQHAALFDTLVAHTDLTQNAEVIGNAELVMSKAKYEDIVFSMDLVKVLPKNCGISKFLIAAILQDKRFKAHCLGYVNGTTVLHLSKKALPEYKLYLPSNMDELKPFDNIVTVLYKEIASNISEITQLELLRDSLLPKLMSGEIDVSAVQL